MIETTRSTPSSSSVPSAAVVALAGVERRFGSVVALAGLDLEVHPGEIVGFLGPNGAGKTTAVSLILGLLDAGVDDGQLDDFLVAHPCCDFLDDPVNTALSGPDLVDA